MEATLRAAAFDLRLAQIGFRGLDFLPRDHAAIEQAPRALVHLPLLLDLEFVAFEIGEGLRVVGRIEDGERCTARDARTQLDVDLDHATTDRRTHAGRVVLVVREPPRQRLDERLGCEFHGHDLQEGELRRARRKAQRVAVAGRGRSGFRPRFRLVGRHVRHEPGSRCDDGGAHDGRGDDGAALHSVASYEVVAARHAQRARARSACAATASVRVA